MSNRQMIKNWLLKAKKDVETAEDLYKSRHYDWCLFIWHLAVEKALKAKILSLNKPIVYVHDLKRLAKETDIIFDSEQTANLNEITSFNLEARYDDYKLSFYKKANKEYTDKWTQICKSIYKLVVTNI
ncbi:DNA-binding protein [Candidatus Roizmanbacteria bacterium CG_4_9_14_3_um_filter_33_18]|uniref:DNA-binding protein n=3 Tax=Candidatus Roizmaniibacteriota TaxID=1752723 RepID=A0A2H0KKR7_9BACT|nr:MAG: DNA-binding protein [Candidatus Roizmanbacteria bacterium CG22_combo_CG10-13_8_21_14_all_34_12]PIQ71848.1 MAG: DNA-binding protein [Candidatus Roizmanbacteria bacterium CG11_big_fil_rev_8_21_14_0_20_37_16]PJA55192.1 MAG: DNA-binding protein [Candidatus Roizmanbacteria bacterium CG_4_9_14_3_um_filter_33_18]